MRFPLPITNAVLKITNGAMEFKSEDIGTIKLTKATFHLKKRHIINNTRRDYIIIRRHANPI